MRSPTRVPDTPLALEAAALAEEVLPRSLRFHSVRTFLLGRAYADKKTIDHDEEGFYLAALFHDLGLTSRYLDRTRPFTAAGGKALRSFLEERGLPPARIAPLVAAIDFHMQLLPRWSEGNVAGLLQVGAWMDVTGLRRWAVVGDARAISASLPRAGFDVEFPVRLVRSIGSAASCLGLVAPGRA